jgi:hypothetical protein
LRQFVADLLAFVQRADPGALDGADMDEDVLAAVIGLNEAEAFLTVEPLDLAAGHLEYLPIGHNKHCHDAAA